MPFLPNFRPEAAGGAVLLAAAACALLISNSPLAWVYSALLETPIPLRIATNLLDKSLLFWINDGLMAIFFFLIGLELKREVIDGELSTARSAALPLIAAVGGMAVPALVYASINIANPAGLRGWAIPAATDIAFAMGVLAVLGARIPDALKVFLLALAVLDDLGAILIIAVFYSQELALPFLALAAIGCAVLVALNRGNVRSISPYLIVGVFVWACVLKSGIHATLSGVVLAMAIPLSKDSDGVSPLERIQSRLAPWVHFGIAPAFAFANSGVSLGGFSLAALSSPIPLGIALGLFVGKQLGIFAAVWFAIRFGLGELPQGASWRQMYGVAALGGIGFTMSLFIGTLAFPDQADAALVRVGVLAGSLASACLGYTVLRSTSSGEHQPGRSKGADTA